MLRFAYQQVGKRYVWGGTGRSGWDCSGLTQAAARKVGVSLPHSAAGQRNRGHAVSRSSARPGDLVTWRGHVGIYVGKGKVLHAPGRGRHVTVAKIWGSPGFRRIAG
jgi:cell wall-associated NlpC family hydrolase